MKNVIKINFNNQAKVGLVTRLNTGTNEVWLSIIGANNGVINLGDITVSITSDDFNYEISSNLWVGDGQLEISVRNSSMTGIYRINKIDELTGDIYIQQDASNLFTLVRGSNFIDELFEEIFNRCYPVGCYFETTDTNFDPNVSWGGTWELEAEGLVHVSAGENYEISTDAQDGGASQITYTPAGTVEGHTLTQAEIPAHRHGWKGVNTGTTVKAQMGNYPFAINQDKAYNWNGTPGMMDTAGGGGSHNHGFTGTDASINVMQPYKVVNRWHRTA